MKTASLILMLSALLAQDLKTLTLKTGDKITGTIVSETETTITIVNPLMGQMTLNKADLKQETVSITLNSGDVVKGIVLEKTSSYFKLESAFGEVTIPTENIKTIGSIKKKDENAPLKSKRTLFGTRWEQATYNDAGSAPKFNACYQAGLDAVEFTSPLWYAGGIIYYVGVPAYFLSKPQPNHYAISNIAPEEQLLYLECYKTAAKNERGKRMALGCTGMLLFFMMTAGM